MRQTTGATTDTFDPETYQSPNIRKYRSDNWLYSRHLKAFQETLFELLTQSNPASVLDAGCGEGFVVKYLKRQDPSLEVTGIDKSTEAVTYARRMIEVDAAFHTGDLYDLPFADGSFDTVVCSEVLEHLHWPDRAVGELKRVARSHVLISVPREPLFRWVNNLGQWLGLSPDPGHRQFWSHASFKSFIDRHLDDPSFRTKHVYQLALGKA